MANLLDEFWLVLTDENGNPLLDEIDALPAALASLPLDTAVAAAQALGQRSGAYTTGTPINTALRRVVAILLDTLLAAALAADAALEAADLSNPAGVLAAVSAAGNAATARAALADLDRLQTILGRA